MRRISCFRQRALAAKGKADILGHGHGIEQGGALEQHAELAAHAQQLPLVHRDDVFALDEHLPGVGLEQADQVLEQHALAAAAAANDDDRLALLNPEAHAVQDGMGAEALLQIADFDHSVWKIWPRVSVRKKLEIRIVIEEYTTASVVARPTPSAPSPQHRPL